jgi:hypothetical protein
MRYNYESLQIDRDRMGEGKGDGNMEHDVSMRCHDPVVAMP